MSTTENMPDKNPLTRKLSRFGRLSEKEKQVLDHLAQNGRKVGSNQDLIKEGDKPDDVRLILDGFACRYKLLPDGGRQIVAYLVPGDFCDLHVFILRHMDHSIATLSPCIVVDITRKTVLELLQHPGIAQALLWVTLVDEAILREWLVGMGRRPAEQRIAHLLCELSMRLHAVGLTKDDGYKLPITQDELADTMGLTSVHVNRVLQTLRGKKLIELAGGFLVIPDFIALQQFSGFDPAYLHLLQEGR